MELKIGRKVFDITDKDVVLYNGACWQLITQTIFKEWNDYHPVMSKAICDKFIKKGILVMYKKKYEYIASNGNQMGMYYYKFDINKLTEYVNQQN